MSSLFIQSGELWEFDFQEQLLTFDTKSFKLYEITFDVNENWEDQTIVLGLIGCIELSSCASRYMLGRHLSCDLGALQW